MSIGGLSLYVRQDGSRYIKHPIPAQIEVDWNAWNTHFDCARVITVYTNRGEPVRYVPQDTTCSPMIWRRDV